MPEQMGQGTSLGRVVIVHQGEYQSGRTYTKLDCVSYNGNSYLYIASTDEDVAPGNTNYWRLLAGKGAKGDQGTTGSFAAVQSATISMLDPYTNPAITVTGDASTDNSNKRFNFDFQIPYSPPGWDTVSASAMSTSSTSPAEASVVIKVDEEDSNQKKLDFFFKIPSAQGAGVQSVDGEGPTYDPILNLNNVQLNALRIGIDYTQESRLISNENKIALRSAIGAQESGNYINATGGTMLNDFNIQSDNLVDNVGTVNADGKKLNFIDANTDPLAYIFPSFSADKTQSLTITSYRVIEDTPYYNNLILSVDSSGNNLVSVSSPSAWQSALSIMPATTIPPIDIAGGATGDAGAFARANHAHPLNVSNDEPVMDSGTNGSAGNSSAYARADHYHPLNIDDEIALASDSGSGWIGSADKYARSNHAHPLNVVNSNPSKDFGANGSWGISSAYARADHYHPLNVLATTAQMPSGIGTASAGDATTYARSNHFHQMPTAEQVGAASSNIISSIPSQATIASFDATSLWNSSSTMTNVWYLNLTSKIQNLGIEPTSKMVFDLRPEGNLINAMSSRDVTGMYIGTIGTNVYLYSVASTVNSLPSLQFQYYELR